MYKEYVDNAVELCENVEEENSEENEFEDDLDEKHFLKKSVFSLPSSIIIYHAFSCRKTRLLTYFYDTPLQPPQI